MDWTVDTGAVFACRWNDLVDGGRHPKIVGIETNARSLVGAPVARLDFPHQGYWRELVS